MNDHQHNDAISEVTPLVNISPYVRETHLDIFYILKYNSLSENHMKSIKHKVDLFLCIYKECK